MHQMAYHFTLLHFLEGTYQQGVSKMRVARRSSDDVSLPIGSHRFALAGNDAHQMATVNVT